MKKIKNNMSEKIPQIGRESQDPNHDKRHSIETALRAKQFFEKEADKELVERTKKHIKEVLQANPEEMSNKAKFEKKILKPRSNKTEGFEKFKQAIEEGNLLAATAEEVKEMTDPKQLVYIAKNTIDGDAQIKAISKITDEKVLGDIVANTRLIDDETGATRRSIFWSISDENVLADIAKTSSDQETREISVGRIRNNKKLLQSIAKNTKYDDTREYIADILRIHRRYLKSTSQIS